MRAPDKTPMHTHDFAEVFWISRGCATHIINGAERAMHIGELCIIRPMRDRHGLHAASGECILQNVAFNHLILRELCRRYPDMARLWHSTKQMPPSINLKDTELQWLEAAADELFKSKPDRLLLDRFLLNMTCSIRRQQTDPLRACPAWLQDACHAIQQPENLAAGIRGLMRLSGRSPAHLARTLKKHTGMTPSEIVNNARIEHAAGQLINTSEDIQNIALNCGFNNLSYFYRVFLRHYGLSPRRFRMKHFMIP